jgi:hypothetical protein
VFKDFWSRKISKPAKWTNAINVVIFPPARGV